MYVWYFLQLKSRFISIIDRKLQQLINGGFIEYYDTEYKEQINSKRYEHMQVSGPKVLTMEHLRAGFIVWLVSVTFAISAFIFEWMCRLGKYLLFKFIIWSFYNQKHLKMIESCAFAEASAKSAKKRLDTAEVLNEMVLTDSAEEEKKDSKLEISHS